MMEFSSAGTPGHQELTEADDDTVIPGERLDPANPDTLLPIIWLHVPKTGSKFETTLVHFACGSKLKPTASLIEPTCGKGPWDGLADGLLQRAGDNDQCHYHGQLKFVMDEVYQCSTTRWNQLCGEGSFA